MGSRRPYNRPLDIVGHAGMTDIIICLRDILLSMYATYYYLCTRHIIIYVRDILLRTDVLVLMYLLYAYICLLPFFSFHFCHATVSRLFLPPPFPAYFSRHRFPATFPATVSRHHFPPIVIFPAYFSRHRFPPIGLFSAYKTHFSPSCISPQQPAIRNI